MLTRAQNAALWIGALSAAFVAAVHVAAMNPCRDPDPPDHPVPVDAPYDPATMPIAAPAAK